MRIRSEILYQRVKSVLIDCFKVSMNDFRNQKRPYIYQQNYQKVINSTSKYFMKHRTFGWILTIELSSQRTGVFTSQGCGNHKAPFTSIFRIILNNNHSRSMLQTET